MQVFSKSDIILKLKVIFCFYSSDKDEATFVSFKIEYF